jgi:hypothetical protein
VVYTTDLEQVEKHVQKLTKLFYVVYTTDLEQVVKHVQKLTKLFYVVYATDQDMSLKLSTCLVMYLTKRINGR